MLTSANTMPPDAWSGPGRPVGTARAARVTRPARPRLTCVWKTIVNVPSGRSPKCSCRIWRARSESVPGTEKEFATEITEQVPDECIAWRSVSGAQNAGMVRFEPLNKERTRVELTMEYEPQTFAEKAADAVGIVSGKVDDAVEKFGRLIEKRGAETGAWRGEVHGGRETGAHGATRGSRKLS